MSMLISTFVLGQTIVAGYGQDRAGSNLDNYYNRRKEVTFSGVVTGKSKGQVPGYAQGMSIMVKSGKTLREVELGPAWYVGRQATSVNLGDKVKITGVPLVLDHREKVILARQIVRGRQVLALRDSGGLPYWSARRERVAVNGAAQRMDRRFDGTIAGTDTFNIGGESYSGYVVDTPNGLVNVAMAPSWYWNNQPSYVHVGDRVTLFGNGPVSNVNGVILANSGYYPGGTIILRPGGMPIWGGLRPLGY